MGLIPRSGGSPKEGNGNPLQYSYLENSMDRGVWSQTPKGHKELDTQRVGHTHIHILNIQILCLYFKDIFQNVQIFFFSYL